MPHIVTMLDSLQSLVSEHHLLDITGPVRGQAVDAQAEVLDEEEHQGLASHWLHGRGTADLIRIFRALDIDVNGLFYTWCLTATHKAIMLLSARFIM